MITNYKYDKHIVLGTAGHVDHGKTTLTKALTGIDTDRLKEEKARGMTIDLGFAPFRLPSGRTVSIVDVPGHERFIRNMVAGATGIDIVMLVVAADEGIMEQTREHLDILSLLGTSTGVVALTKIDLVDQEFLGMVIADIEDYLKGTFLGGARIIPVSSVTGEGIPELVSEIDRLAGVAESTRIPPSLFRLPVDRVFTIAGYGTVVTGTVAGGEIGIGEEVEVLPPGRAARIRGIQVHARRAERAVAGDRAALNLAGIQKDEIERGYVVARPGTLAASTLVDATLTVLRNTPGVSHGQRVRMHIGTAEVMARIRVMGADSIAGGEEGYTQLVLEEPTVAARGDRFIIRSYSPVRTIGGGRVLMHNAPRRRRFSQHDLDVLAIEESGSLQELIELVLKEQGNLSKTPRGAGARVSPVAAEELAARLLVPIDDVKRIASEMAMAGAGTAEAELKAPAGSNAVGIAERRVVILPGTERMLSGGGAAAIRNALLSTLDDFYCEFPMRLGMPKDELRMKVAPHWDEGDFDAFLLLLQEPATGDVPGVPNVGAPTVGDVPPVSNASGDNIPGRAGGWTGGIIRSGNMVMPPGVDRERTIAERPEVLAVETAYRDDGLNPRKLPDILASNGISHETGAEIMRFLLETGRLVRLGGTADGVILHADALERARSEVIKKIKKDGSISASELRDALKSSRRLVIPILEYFDRIKLTSRVGDVRKAGPGFPGPT
ncbi:MAG: selenocysteine-specific translation elongation factor [Firmicutes bacterium]|nr:selenocysteine-specific translation elongation factor [Bacillota bacterium]